MANVGYYTSTKSSHRSEELINMLSRGSAYIAHPFSNHLDYVEALAAVTVHYPDDMRKRNAKGVTSFVRNAINYVRFLQNTHVWLNIILPLNTFIRATPPFRYNPVN